MTIRVAGRRVTLPGQDGSQRSCARTAGLQTSRVTPMHVLLPNQFGERYDRWRTRVRGVESSFLDVWSRPMVFATAVFGLGVAALVLNRAGLEVGRLADAACLILLAAAVGAARFTTRGLQVNRTVEEVVRQAGETRRAAHRAMGRLPEPVRAEVLAEVQRVLHVLGGLALTAVTILMLVAAAVAGVPLLNLAVAIAPQAGGFLLAAVMCEAAILVTAFVRLVVQTEARSLPARVAVVAELDDLAATLARPREG